MSCRRPSILLTSAAIATCLLAFAPYSATGQPPAVDSSAVDRAVEDLEASRLRSARVSARLEDARAELDRVVTEQAQARGRLSSRASLMYRMGSDSLVSVLLGARSFGDFAARWDLLVRMSESDAADLAILRAARRDLEDAARDLMALQSEGVRAVEEAEQQVADARSELAASETALAEYEARLAEEPEPEPATTPSDDVPQVTGSGPWETGVASHYSRTFTGKGASGEPIGPYSMMVAHRTLPFGTLVEFEYRGRVAVASVEDRGPHVEGRMWDLGPGVARALDFSGVDEVRYRVIGQ